MPVGISGQGFIGLAFETVYGTYAAPTKFFPILSEDLNYKQDTQWRRDIRGLVDNLGAIGGYSHVEGSIEAYLMEDMLPYFLHVGRMSIVKSGTTDFTYVTTPTHVAVGQQKVSMSITVVRAGVTFGYTGLILSQLGISVDNSIPKMKFGLVGADEITQTLPTPAFLTTSVPFAAGTWSVEVPTATAVTDTTDVQFTLNDNADPQNRLANSTRAQFVSFKQREVMLELTRDFNGRTEYDTFKALTASSVTFTCTKSALKKVTVKIPAAIRDDYQIDGLSDQGSLHMAKAKWQGTYDVTTSKACEITVICQENIT